MRRIVFILLFLLWPGASRAQQNAAPRPRPKIGVALEGGGAMGLAHIGVLKWFEEHHIPVDYVAGTSMGGLVGGFYATGMTPDELKTLIEGMDWRKILDNLPTDVVREMGAEIVIAVHLESAPVDAKDIQSVFGVLNHSVRVVLEQNELRGLAQADAVVSVPLSEYNTVDYAKSAQIMKRGYEAANARAPLLEAFALDDASWQEYQQVREARKRRDVPTPQFIEVEGTNAHEATDVTRYVKRFQGKPVNPEKLDEVLTRLTGVGRYDSAGYRLIEKNGQTGLLVDVVEKNYAPPMFQTAFEVDGSQSGNVDFTAGTRFTFMDVAGFRSEWRTDVLLGNTYGIQTELFRPFRAESRWFFAPHADASDTTFQIYAKNDPLADYRIYRINVGGDVGYSLGRFSELRVGYEVGSLNTKLRLGSPEIPSVAGRVGQARLRYLLDHTDDPVIPRRGFSAETNFRWFDQNPGANGAFPSMDLKLGFFQPIARRASLFLESEGGTTFGNTSTGVPQFFLGGPVRLSAYGQNEFHGNQYYLVRAGFLRDLLILPPFLGKKVYAVGAYEIGKMYGVTTGSDLPDDVAAGFLAETAIGPFFIGGSVGDSGHRKWFFQLGRVF